jgi:hypothetical protein
MLLLRSSLGWKGGGGKDLHTKKQREQEIHDTYVYGLCVRGRECPKGLHYLRARANEGGN